MRDNNQETQRISGLLFVISNLLRIALLPKRFWRKTSELLYSISPDAERIGDAVNVIEPRCD